MNKIKIFCLISLIFLVASCSSENGGSGSSAGGVPDGETAISFTKDNSHKAAFCASKLLTVVYPNNLFDTSIGESSGGGLATDNLKIAVDKNLFKIATENLYYADGEYKNAIAKQGATTPTTTTCSGGGTQMFKAQWDDGPSAFDSSHTSLFSNVKTSATYSSCVKNGITFNGRIETLFEGKYNNPSKVAITCSSYRITQNTNYALYDMSIAVSDIKDTTNIFNDSKVNMTGTLSGSKSSKTFDLKFNNFEYKLESKASTSSTQTAVTMNGAAYDKECLKYWVVFETQKEMLYSVNEACPKEGELVIKGNEPVQITFATDKTIKLSFDGSVLKTFTQCDQMASMSCDGLTTATTSGTTTKT